MTTVLYIGGLDLIIHPNHRAHHFITFLERQVTRVDVVSMTGFYSGAWFASPWARFRQGLRASAKNRVQSVDRQKGIELMVRKLPGRLDPVVQDLWAYLHIRSLLQQRYDVCIFGNPVNVLLPLFLKRKGVVGKVIYDDWDYYQGFDRSWLWKLLIRWRNQIGVSIADVVISVGSLLAELRKTQGAKKSFVIPNGVDYPLFAMAHRKKLHPPTLVYIGKLAEEYGIDISIRGFAQVRDMIPTARYLIIGYNEGPYALYLSNLVDELGLNDNVRFLGRKKYDELPQFLAEADIGIALFKPNDLMKYAFPLKVVEYMAAGLAVVGTKIGETEKLILESEAGEAVDYSAGAFANAVINILSDPVKLAQYLENAKAYAQVYDWNVLFSDFLNIVDTELPMHVPSGIKCMPARAESRE
jgi:glycosyltransferase involved in cell wall biosynthesis